jgi:N-acetylglucosaminyl-diphospho-decaprenol L-rhamnosyltransferase
VSEAGLRVVVLSYGGGGEYRALIDALLADGLEPASILIVHNPSAPGEPAPSDVEGCEVLRASHNLGYAAGMNLGIERQLRHGGELLLLLLTHDARLRPGSLGLLLDAARESPRYGALGPVLLLSGTEVPFSYGGVNRADGGVEHRKSAPAGEGGEIAPCDWIDGGTMLLRGEALREVGPFDARFWGYAEDADLCLRIRRAGLGVGVVLGASADQDSGAAKRPGPWAYLITRNGLAYARRAAGARGLARLGAKTVLYALREALRSLARASRLRPGPARDTWAVAVGMARGLADFARGRWGPPPSLPGAGDLTNLDGAEGG